MPKTGPSGIKKRKDAKYCGKSCKDKASRQIVKKCQRCKEPLPEFTKTGRPTPPTRKWCDACAKAVQQERVDRWCKDNIRYVRISKAKHMRKKRRLMKEAA
jgi:hypothetical protein